MDEADTMVHAVEARGIKFNYGTQRRFMPLYKRLRQLIAAGELGDLQCVIAHFGAAAALWGLTHAADLLLFLAGDPPVEFVQGTIICKDEDWEGNRLHTDPAIASGYVRFANGVHGYLTVGTGAEVEICGTKGKLRTLNNGAACHWRRVTEPYRILEDTPFPDVPRESGTLNGIEDIAEALDSGRETQGSIQCARRSLEMLLGMIESHRLGGRRVPLPLENRSLYVGRADW
jgi:predicted dehydrogenase